MVKSRPSYDDGSGKFEISGRYKDDQEHKAGSIDVYGHIADALI